MCVCACVVSGQQARACLLLRDHLRRKAEDLAVVHHELLDVLAPRLRHLCVRACVCACVCACVPASVCVCACPGWCMPEREGSRKTEGKQGCVCVRRGVCVCVPALLLVYA